MQDAHRGGAKAPLTTRKVLVPHQQDLGERYNRDGVNTPMIINQRFVDWVNSHENMLASVISYDPRYIEYISTTRDDIAVLLPGGMDIGQYPERDSFEEELVRTCVENDVPLFGVCKGMQVINCALGGTLREVDGHWQSHVEHAPTHSVRLEDGIFFDHLIQRTIDVNSFHNWAIDEPGDGIEICGWSTDAEPVAECLKVAGKPIAAVQWHPSYMIDHYASKELLDLFYALR